MERAKVEFVAFDSADVIATSRGIRYGFLNGELYRFSAKDEAAYNTQPYSIKGYKPDSRVTEIDAAAFDFWSDNYGNTVTIDGEAFSTGDWDNVTKWLFLNRNADPENITADDWWLVNRSGQ